LHVDAVGAQHRKPSPANERERILHRRDNATNAGGDDPLGTGSCLTGVNTRLESAIESRSTSATAGLFERIDLGMRLTRAFMRTLAKHDALVRHGAGPDTGVRRRATEAAAPGLECPPHPPLVVYHFSWKSAST